MTTIEVLEAALESLTEERWRKGPIIRVGTGDTCLSLSILFAASSGEEEALAKHEVCQTIDGAELVLWNDAPDRTLAQVRAVVVETIERLKQGGGR